jgi:hypothetical protein
MPSLLSTGDDEGVIKVSFPGHVETITPSVVFYLQLWDPRQQKCTRTYTHHFDYITDFLFLDDSKQLVATRYYLDITSHLFGSYNYMGCHNLAAMEHCQ